MATMTPARQLASEDVFKLIGDTLGSMETSDDPAQQIINVGRAMEKIGMALKGHSLGEARKIITAARTLVLD